MFTLGKKVKNHLLLKHAEDYINVHESKVINGVQVSENFLVMTDENNILYSQKK